MNFIIFLSTLFIELALGAHVHLFESFKHLNKTVKSRQIATEQPKRFSTFITLIDKSYITPYYIPTSINTNQQQNIIQDNKNLYHVFNGINLNFEQLKFFLIGILIIAFVLIVIIIWILKKFTNCFLLNCCLDRLCCRTKNSSIDPTRSDSAMSGECGCVIRLRKDRNQANVLKYKNKEINRIKSNQNLLANVQLKNQNIYNFQPNLKRMVSVSLNEIDSNHNYFRKIPINKVKSALVLIAVKVSFNNFIQLFYQKLEENQRRTIINHVTINISMKSKE